MRIRVLSVILAATCLAAPVVAVAATSPTTRICLRNSDITAQRVSADTGYFVQTRQGWWRNTTSDCASFGPNRFVVQRSTNDQQCRGDVVNLVDRSSQINFGGCSLGNWEKVEASAVPPPFNH